MKLRVLAAVLVFGVGVGACKKHPSDLREWRASDHSREPGQSSDNETPPEDNDPMIAAEAVWGAQCATCHGPEGHGDGPQAPLTHPPDLTDSAFQAAHSEQEMRVAITNGRNLMPAFGNAIRPEGIDALVQLVRTLGQRR